MAVTIITDLLTNVDKIGANYVQNAYTALNDAMQVPGAGGPWNIFQLLLILYIIYWGFEIWAGTARGTPTEIFWRLFRVMIIFTFAQTWGDFQFYVYDFLNKVPNSIGNAIVGSMTNVTNGVNNASANSVASQLDNILNLTWAGITSFTAKAGFLSFLLDFLGVLIYAAIALMVFYAGFLVILAKLFTWILLAIAPIIVVLALFRVTSQFVVNWVKLLLEYFFLQILVYAFLAFYLDLTQSYFSALATTLTGNIGAMWSDITPVLAVAIIGFALLTQLQVVAGALVGIQSFQRGYLGGAWRMATGLSNSAGDFMERGFQKRNGYSIADRKAVKAEVGREAYKQTAAYKALADKLKNSGKMSGSAGPGGATPSPGTGSRA
ncbi:MAG: type IV secretion system protein [Acidocella sp.]|nr:type IV secretion system protein [Acidocella sp.]